MHQKKWGFYLGFFILFLAGEPLSAQDALAKKTLIVYNRNGGEGISLKNYYFAKRPGIQGAYTLGLYTTVEECISNTDYKNQIRLPIVNWFKAKGLKKVDYIILMRGIPTRLKDSKGLCPTYRQDGPDSVQKRIFSALSEVKLKTGASFGGGGLPSKTYVGADYPGTTALVTHLDMGSLGATTAYLDKIALAAAKTNSKSLAISGRLAFGGGSTFFMDDIYGNAELFDWAHRGQDARDAMIRMKVFAPVVYRTNIVQDSRGNKLLNPNISPSLEAHDVAGYYSMGVNGGLNENYALNGQVNFTGSSSWFVVLTGESFNGIRNAPQGNFEKWFSPNAFGGAGYSNTPIGVVTHVEEPSIVGLNRGEFFALWAKGWNFANCAWATRQTPYFAAFGDPFVVH